MNRLMRWLRSPWPAAVVLTLVTVVAIGAVLAVTTSTGCRMAQNAGLHLNAAKCQNPSRVAGIPSQIPTPSPIQTGRPSPSLPGEPSPSPSPSPTAVGSPSPSPSASNVPHNPALPPYEFDAGTSGAYPPPTYPAPSGLGQPDNVGLSCRLPIYSGGPGSGGFLVFPDRTFIGDPRSGVTVPSPSPGGPSPVAVGPGGQQGFYGLAYDRAAARWVPVPQQWISPDGKRYAYPGIADGIFVVDVATNTQTELGAGRRWHVLDLEAEGVYVDEFVTAGSLAGLWLLPYSGAPSQITDAGYWTEVGYGAAYGTENSSVPNGVPNLIERLDLKTHVKVNWFQVNNATTYPDGFDAAGHPIFNVQGVSGYAQLWLVTDVGATQVLTANNGFTGPPVADSNGLWLMSYQATYLLVPGQGLFTAAAVGGQLAGGCA